MDQKPKKGDVVWMEQWGGVIGIFEAYNGFTLTLSWPKDLTWRFVGQENVRTFSPVESSGFVVLSPKDVLEKMAGIVAKRLKDVHDRSLLGISAAFSHIDF